MKKLLLASVMSVGFMASAAYADVNPAMKDSKYCQDAGASDPLCMGPETMAMRTKMMEFTKDKAMASRTKYCEESGASDPVCEEKMLKDTTGY